jgi:hypothetical protein
MLNARYGVEREFTSESTRWRHTEPLPLSCRAARNRVASPIYYEVPIPANRNNHNNNHRNNNGNTVRADDAGHEAADEATRTSQAVTEEAAKATGQAMRAGVDIARRTADTARENVQSGLNTAVKGFRRATEQFTQVLGFAGPDAEELARRSYENIEAVSQASTVVARGFQEASQEWFGFVQQRVTKNIEGLGRLTHCRSAQDFIAVQSDLARDNMQQVIETSRRLGQVSVRVADEAAGIIQAEASTNTDRIRRVA